MKTIFWAFFLVVLSGCSHFAKNPTSENPNRPLVFSSKSQIEFVSMGTLWRVWIAEPAGRSLSYATLGESLSAEVYKLDLIFSDWNQKSELRRLEKSGLTKFQKASPEFLKGLKWAKYFYDLSEGSFDITVGAVLWKVASVPVGMESLELRSDDFKFRTDPKRLSFSGFIKGATVGLLADKLLRAGISTFRIDGGGGNIIEGAPGSFLLISRSAAHQGPRQHIINPKNPSQRLSKSVELKCSYLKQDQPEKMDWAYESARVDAITKVLLLRPEFTGVPENCEAHFRQEKTPAGGAPASPNP